MKLLEVWLCEPIRDDAQTPLAHLSELKGHALSYDQGLGMVIVSGNRMARERFVPKENVSSMVPAVAVAQIASRRADGRLG